MGIFSRKFETLEETLVLEAPEEDYRKAVRVGQYRIGKDAIYRPDGKYLPLGAVTDMVHDRASVHVSGCCAGGVYVERIVLTTPGGKFPFTFDTKKEVATAKELIGAAGRG